MAHLFRFKGRMARLPFVGWTLVLMVLELVLYLAMALITGHDMDQALTAYLAGEGRTSSLLLIEFAAVLVLLYPSLAISVQRLHDMGWPGWWTLLPVLVFVTLYLFEFLGLFSKGDEGPNLYDLIAMVVLFPFLVLLVLMIFKRGSAGPNIYGPAP